MTNSDSVLMHHQEKAVQQSRKLVRIGLTCVCVLQLNWIPLLPSSPISSWLHTLWLISPAFMPHMRSLQVSLHSPAI